MRAQGKPVVDLGLGEPDFDTPIHIIDAAYRAALNGETRYTNTSGTHALRSAVSEKFLKENNLHLPPNQVFVANGAKQVIFNALMATLEFGHEVIFCAPYFDSYRNMVKVLGGEITVIQCRAEDNFILSPEALEHAITPATRWLILNSPSNPAGAVYRAAQYRALGDVLARHPHVLVMSDEIYEHIVFDNVEFVSFAAVCPELCDRTLTINGVSKAYAMTGWRIGYGGGPTELINAMTTIQSQICSGASAISQAAALAALTGPQDCVEAFRNSYQARRDLVVEAVSKIDGLKLQPPEGAFYALIDAREALKRRAMTDVEFVHELLDRAGVAAVPGSVYEMPGFFRISTASNHAILEDAMNRIASLVQKSPSGVAA